MRWQDLRTLNRWATEEEFDEAIENFVRSKFWPWLAKFLVKVNCNISFGMDGLSVDTGCFPISQLKFVLAVRKLRSTGVRCFGGQFRRQWNCIDFDLITEYRIPKLYKLLPSRYGDLLYEGSLDEEDVTSIVVAIERNKVVVQSIRLNYSFKFKPITAKRINWTISLFEWNTTRNSGI